MSKHLEHELDRLETQLLTLSAQVEESIHAAVRALENRDVALAEQIIHDDRIIDEMEVDLEEECLKILALYQPVAGDLRFIIAALKINNELERVGDLAASVAKRVRKLAAAPPIDLPVNLRELAEKTLSLLRQSLDSFVRLDTQLAHQVCFLDKEVDKRNRAVEKMVTQALKETPDQDEAMLQILWVARSLERVGDHATNIAEDVIYMLEGEIVRHTMKKKNSAKTA